MSESWRVVQEHPDYEVSDLGRVRSWRARSRPYADGVQQRRDRPRLLRPAPDKRGYFRVTLDGRTRAVHHLVLLAFVGPRPTPKHEGRHHDGKPGNNRPGNLSWATHAENEADKRRHGTHNNGAATRCRRRGHLLAGANVRSQGAAGGRRCVACWRARVDPTYWAERGVFYDEEVLAAQWYAYLMEGAPKPRSTPELEAAARVPGTSPRPAWSTTQGLRASFRAGEVFSPAEARERVRGAGIEVGDNAVGNALARCVERGEAVRVAAGRYRWAA